MRLDRLIRKAMQRSTREARGAIAAGAARVDGRTVRDPALQVSQFQHIEVDGVVLQMRTPRYVLLHKPSGVLSATSDSEHQTVIDLIDEPWAEELHLAGRLDRFTTGLVVLTNDSRFSEGLTAPHAKVAKVYAVTTDLPISAAVIAAFHKGVYLAKEKVITQPAAVDLRENPCHCMLTIYEGKHHQVKRMFAQFSLRVTTLHRESVGDYHLGDLAAGEYRVLAAASVRK